MKIGEFSQKSGIAPSTLRYYEKKGFLTVKRINGVREFEESDLAFAAFIKRLKEMGMPLTQIKKYADLRYQGDTTIAERLKLLDQHRYFLQEKLAQYQDYIAKLDNKTELYRQVLERKKE